jgi:hypothetical protein
MGAAVSTPTHATNDFELAIRSSKELEWILEQEFSASGKGLHEKITSAAHECPDLTPSLVRNMRYLATIRNKLVHERGFDAIPDRNLFIIKFETSQEELKTILTFRRSQRKSSGTKGECNVM